MNLEETLKFLAIKDSCLHLAYQSVWDSTPISDIGKSYCWRRWCQWTDDTGNVDKWIVSKDTEILGVRLFDGHLIGLVNDEVIFK